MTQAVAQEAGPPIFPGELLDLGDGTVAVALADLDADGHHDLAACLEHGSDIVLLRGSADGSLADMGSLPVGVFPRAVVAADLDGDGSIDLATANASTGDVSIVLASPGGGFLPEQRVALTPIAAQADLAVGDLDGDGDPDLAVLDVEGAHIGLILGEGGSFAHVLNIPTRTAVLQVELADLDGDGRADIVGLVQEFDAVAVWPNRGHGAFGPPIRLTVGSDPVGLVVADLDADGRPDLATADGESDTVSVLLNDGVGGFAARQVHAAPDQQRWISAGRVTADLSIDLVTGGPELLVLGGDGQGRFEPVQQTPAQLGWAAAATGDIDGNGRDDLVSAGSGLLSPVRVIVHLAEAPAGFAAAQDVFVETYADRLLAGDVVEDGWPDVLTNGATTLYLLAGLGEGALGAPAPVLLTQTWVHGWSLADLNVDGHLDLVLEKRVAFGDGQGGFTPPASLPTDFLAAEVAIADVNVDGLPDIVAAESSYSAAKAAVLAGDGTGQFASGPDFPIDLNLTDLELGDLNVDGLPDAVLASNQLTQAGITFYNGRVGVRLGLGTDTFQPLPPVGGMLAADFPWFVAIGDLTADGLPDVVTRRLPSSYDMKFAGSAGLGDGWLGAKLTEPIEATPSACVVVDLHGDGLLDVVLAQALVGAPTALRVSRGSGKISLDPSRLYAIHGSPNDVVVTDFDADGRLDAAVIGSGHVDVLLQRSGP